MLKEKNIYIKQNKQTNKSFIFILAFLKPLFNISFLNIGQVLALECYSETKFPIKVPKEGCKGKITPGLDERRTAGTSSCLKAGALWRG